MKLSLLDIIAIITAFQLFLLGFVMSHYTTGKRLNRIILSVFLFSNGLFVLHFFLFNSGIMSSRDFPLILYLSKSLYFLFAPLLYLYTKSLCYKNFQFRKIHWLHVAPYWLAFLLDAVSYVLRRYESVDPSTASLAVSTELNSAIIHSGLHVQIILYSAAIIKTIYTYRSRLKEAYSNIENINLSWWLLIFMTFILMWLMDFSNWIVYLLHIEAPGVDNAFPLLSLTINFIFATTMVYKGLKQPAIFSGIEDKPKYALSKLTKEACEQHLSALTQYMKNYRPYLDPELTLSELAERIAIHPRYLSQEINDSLQQNFYDFINSYRIEEAKSRLRNPANHNKTVLEILYEVGFNSKSVFNKAFKKHTGTTPSQFRNRSLLA